MARLRLALMGTIEVTLDGQAVAGFAYDKVRALLIYLALEAGRPHRRAELAALLWPDQPDHLARNSLRAALTTLRQAIGDADATPPFLLITSEAVRFNAGSDHVLDVALLTGLLAACEQHDHYRLENCTPCVRRLEQVAALYRGSFLQGFDVRDSSTWEEWALLKRQSLHHSALQALVAVAAYYERRGMYARAHEYAWRQVELDPWSEEGHRQLMRTCTFLGRRTAALRQYEACCRVLREELHVAPEQETIDLYQRIRSGAFDTSSMPCAPPEHLPTQLTSFVGRAAERAVLAGRLTALSCRLLTLVGPPGIGKTRLALQVAADIGADFADGVSFVPLAPIADPSLVVATIARTLQVEQADEQPLIDSLKAFARDKHLLLVLDNFEQVLEGAPSVAALLASAPYLTVLATSREPLHLYGEYQHQVRPLALPDQEQLPPVERLATYEAVELFVERAQAAHADFVLTDANAPALVEICRRVDGLPLGIELAAARVRHSSPDVLLHQLNSRLDLLTGGARDLPPRHQALRAAIAWSYDLLDDAEQTLFRRLGVFLGGWTEEAAEAVAGCRGQEPAGTELDIGDTQAGRSSIIPVADRLRSLVDKNVVRQEQGSTGGWRFSMLETLGEYARERLEASGEAEAMRRRHAAYFTALAEAAAPELQQLEDEPHAGEWLERLEVEQDNMRAALSWMLERGEVELALRLVVALRCFWTLRLANGEGRQWLDAALSRSAGVLTPTERGLRVKALFAAGLLAADMARETALFEESLALAQTLGDKQGMAMALVKLGILAYRQGSFARAQELREESLGLLRETGERQGVFWTLHFLSMLAREQGDHVRAQARFDEGLALARQIEDTRARAHTLVHLGMNAFGRRDMSTALALREESLELFRQVGDRWGTLRVLGHLGAEARALQNYVQAARLDTERLVLAQDLGDKRTIAGVLRDLGATRRDQGHYKQATMLLRRSLSLWQELRDKAGSAQALHALGETAFMQRHDMEAQTLEQESVRLWRELGEELGMAWPLHNLGYLARRRGDYTGARACHTESLRVLRDLRHTRGIAMCLAGFAGIAGGEGAPARAARLFGAAAALFETAGEPPSPAHRWEIECDTAGAQKQVDLTTWEAAWAEGWAMTLEQAIAYALEEINPE